MAARLPASVRLTLQSFGLIVALATTAGAQPQEVDVVNPSLSVQVENPFVEVFVDNDTSEPIPVTVLSSPVEVPILITLYEWDYTLGNDAMRVETASEICVGAQPSCSSPSSDYYVPDNKVLVIETVSVSGSIAAGSVPSQMAADVAIRPPGAGEFVFAIGRADYVHPQSKTFQTSFTGTLRAGAGSQVRGGVFWSSTVAGASATVRISGRLVDAPVSAGAGPRILTQGSVDTELRSVESNLIAP